MGKLRVAIVKAKNLRHLNFSGDAPWCCCEIQKATNKEQSSNCKTQVVKNTLDPVWNETHELDNWRVGDSLVFTVYDHGVLSSKTEGVSTLESGRFYPGGFDG